MHMSQFDPEALARQLQSLDVRKQALFGWACCCRLQPTVQRFQAEIGPNFSAAALRQGLEEVIEFVKTGAKKPAPEIQALAATCEALASKLEDFDSLYADTTQDAMLAVCNLMNFAARQTLDSVVNAARYPTDSVDLYVQEVENMHPQDPELERKILNHRLMQQELRRQQRDLSEIADLRLDDAPPLEAFVTRARSEDCLE